MTCVCGIGWVLGREWGSLRLRRTGQAPVESDLAAAWRNSGVFAFPVKDFARFNRAAQLTCFAGALALRDAGEAYGADAKRDAALLGTNECGSLLEDEEYFRDYVAYGRALARGALFVYTLPSSGLAEAAIHFGFQGPLLYMGGERGSIAYLLRTAAAMIDERETQAALVMQTGPTHAISFYLRDSPPAAGPALRAVADCADRRPGDLPALLKRLGDMF